MSSRFIKAALEYAKSLLNRPNSSAKPVCIVPVGIVYCDKSRYRSVVIVTFGPPIDVQPYLSEFLSDPRTTVKRLTKDTEAAIQKLTINAPDWYECASPSSSWVSVSHLDCD